MANTQERQNIVIVGGGNVGISTFNALAGHLDATNSNLILITPRPYFTHLPAALRLVVTSEGKLEETVLMPFGDKHTGPNKKVLNAKVASIVDSDTKGRHVVLENGDKIDFSVLVLTPGSIWEGPINFPDDKEEHLEWINTWREKFAEANDIVLVELAGELKDLSPKKNVTIVHGQKFLLNDTYPERWRKNVASQFLKRGVKLVLDDFVDDLEIKDGHITTRGKKTIPADLVVSTRGPRPNTKFVESLGTDVLTSSGYIKVQLTLQLPNHPRVFAGGDAMDWVEQKQAGKAPAHAAVIANNVLSVLGSKKSPIPYKGSMEMVVLTNGKASGAGYFGILWGITIGSWLSSLIKSKSLLVGMMQGSLGFD
ncbi:hypothetical protein M413DRAFT_31768 [Hebeloma cylindrosporum]|uniref:FAD/NAD(P)-binding domain-containing protein n=1 Tax=Hebeloma cylindrosporum TaxID=76867 RepID=A0A0C2XEK0_HEBCY|nr:hypothetical protein M413DRAFT_31768 [Hebeloma cylindrosporum h7]